MKIHFTAKSKAPVTEYWCVAAPDNWHEMSEGERRGWLAENIENAELRSEYVHEATERNVLDYHRSRS